MTLASTLTLIRILLVPFLIYLIYLPDIAMWTAIFFAGLSLTDLLDGWLARKYDQVSDFGKFLDPLADKLLIISILIVFAVQMRIEVFSVLILTAREFVIMGLRLMAVRKGIVIGASMTAKLKTMLQMIAIFFILANWQPSGLVLYYLSFIVAIWSLIEYLWLNREVLR